MKTVVPYTFTHPDTQETISGIKLVTYENGSPMYEEELPPVTGEQWVELQGFSALQVLALSRFEQSILQSGLVLGPKMAAVRDWLQALMAEVAQNNEAHRNWAIAPFSFSEAASEALATLAPQG